MAKVELKGLVDRLNNPSRAALEDAASVCVAHCHREVMIEHFLMALAEKPSGDLRILLQAYAIDPQRLIEGLKSGLERFRHGDGNSPVFSPLLIELLQDAWMVASIELGETSIRSGAVLVALLQDLGRFARFEYAALLDAIPRDAIKRDFAGLTRGSVEEPTVAAPANGRLDRADGGADSSALAKFAHNFTEQARQGKIDPVFCRDLEIRQIVDILARRRKNNPICVGEAGVGKTAVVEGLALKIVEGDVPESLAGAEIYGLDLGALQAGASVKGEFEKRLKAVLDEVKQADRRTILFIDEAHTLIGAGGQAGGSDAANLLKPALARGEIRTIAATTWSEYKKYFEKDPALTRRFQLVKLDEPTPEQARIILRGLVPAYERAHDGVYISEAGLDAAVRLSARYITGRQLPDKAIDVLDTACARVRVAASGLPLVIERLRRSVIAMEQEKATLQRDFDTGLADRDLLSRLEIIDRQLVETEAEQRALEANHAYQAQLRDSLKSLLSGSAADEGPEGRRAAIVLARQQFDNERKRTPLTALEVGAAEIASVISDWTGIPVSSMAQDEVSGLLSLAISIGEVVKGQDHALKAIEEQLQSAKLDLHQAGRPLGVFLLVGPSGVGKTETALQVARKMFGGEQFMTTFNMTEFQEKHTVSRLIGSPPGYVGFGEGGILTEAIRKKPYSVVLLDEVEKADPDVLNLFYQAFDKGTLSDGEGREIDCKNTIFILASNLASDEILDLATASPPLNPDTIRAEIEPVLARHFKPALLARMQPIVYLPLKGEVMREIILARVSDLTKTFMVRQGLEFSVAPGVIELLQALCTQGATGARLVDKLIQRRVLPEISRELLRCSLEERHLLSVEVKLGNDGEFAFAFRKSEDEPALEATQ
ncbi:type VI secretion system ATPase TssH [Neorhizobium sp. T786]|uniref:type VI secretion system ATPase TssH n=1 Tax=Pseudorhizobium xiangyangii TaxID=2883104 RepID=UPI001CFFA2AE|nr:type VI secretion system ATPase TssH [Neorhizobium xiangyangii]MCB5205270.1 type VI secretion system ATPase TssH [Neorhizobium xiangyangii]